MLAGLLWVHRCPRAVRLKNESLRFCWVDAGLRLYTLRNLHDLFCRQLPVASDTDDNCDNERQYDNNVRDNGWGSHGKAAKQQVSHRVADLGAL